MGGQAGERNGYCEWLQVDRLGSVVGTATGLFGRAGERSRYSFWLRVDGPWSVVGIATF